jgi:hypothetical protein
LLAISRPFAPASILLAGAAAGLALDVRPAYAPFIPMMGILICLAWLDQRRTRRITLTRCMLCVGLFGLGFVAASLPQSLAAHHHYGSWNFIPGRPEDLAEEHFEKGLYSQRYDTFVSGGNEYPVIYPDKTGLKLLEEQPGHEIKTLSQYATVVSKHPITIAALLARHVVNGFDMRYSTPYVEHLNGGHLLLRLAGFLLVFLALVRLLWPAARRSLGRMQWRYPVALLLCCATSVFAAVEVRYMLPAWLLVYMLVLAPGWPNPIDSASTGLRRFRTLAILGAGYVVFTAEIWHVVSGATAVIVR